MCFYIILPIFAENKRFMETLRIKEQCKKRGMTMAELASKLGITPVSFSQALKNGISVARLYKIAEVLKVDVVDLLPPQEHKRPAIDGFIEIEGYTHRIRSVIDLEKALNLAKSLSANIGDFSDNDRDDYNFPLEG
jgi:transcriptional regulator with XRE-family HTH domain